MVFLPQDEERCTSARRLFEQGLAQFGWICSAGRAVPLDETALGERARSTLRRSSRRWSGAAASR